MSHLLDSWHAATFAETNPTHVIQTLSPHLRVYAGLSNTRYAAYGRAMTRLSIQAINLCGVKGRRR